MMLVKWSPVLPVVFVDCPDTNNRYKNKNITDSAQE